MIILSLLPKIFKIIFTLSYFLILIYFIYLLHNIFIYILFIINAIYIYYIIDLQMTQTTTHELLTGLLVEMLRI